MHAKPGAPLMARTSDMTTSNAVLAAILNSLEEDKAEDIVQIDLRGKTEIGDHMIICSGRSTRQVSAISEKLAQKVKDEFGRSPKIEGKDIGDWVLIDTGDVIVHVFRPEVREFYQLEKMWMDGGEVASPQN
ncbi:ribosomal silencing factor RsfS [Sulfitobacter pacificus]|uniref:Ribosomal silencing factor RsfS n=2 Tax=Sulfitobacter pacificus TaxID=1499314 RepID=A0ABQ5VM77_9RHOB|nr:ribosomal silencing factor RsfS [Sulfitobacter pacificus]